MKFPSQIKPISYLKAHASEIIRNVGDKQKPLVITLNGEAKAVLQDVHSFEQTQETMALLKILALGNAEIEKSELSSPLTAIRLIKESRKKNE